MKENPSEQEWLEISDVFHSIVELSKSEREAVLSSITDERKRAEIEKLLIANDAEQSFLESSPLKAIQSEEVLPQMPEKIGRYKILEQIGRGGMGAVYLAEREDLKKKVALKIIKRGMDTDEILRRFQTERQILANLEHSNIARLLDGGVSEDGLPFIVMEYVDGKDLLDFCAEKDLSLNAKLDLFRKICAAVSYAHQNLVVHRDLKPSNILVNKNGEPKLLDFGISKLLTNETNETGTATSLGMMTPNYASPEQFRGETVSTATDIYSLGVILFELLTGNLPYEIRSKRFEEAARIVAETEPRKPSSIIQDSKFKIQDSSSENGYRFQTEDSNATDDKLKTKNQNQNTNPKSKIWNPKFLRGDLDNIILKALRKEPERRYSSVEQFSEDIRRHQIGFPVTARPDTFSYRASKFFQRNRIGVVSAGLIFLALIGGVIGTSWQAVRAERQRALAEKRFGDVRQLANNAVFKYYEQIKDLDGATEARETLVKDATEYLDKLAQDAKGDVSLQKDLVKAYFRLGDVLGAPHANANTGDTAGALENYGKADKIINDLLTESPNEIEYLNLKRNLHTKIGEIRQREGNAEETRKNFLAAVEISEKIVEKEPNVPKNLSALGQSFVLYGETLPLGLGENESIAVASKGFPHLEKALQIDANDSPSLQRLNMANIRIGLQVSTLAREAENRQDEAKARELYKRAAELFRKAEETAQKLVVSDGKNAGFARRLFISRFNESMALSGLGQLDEALKIQQETLEQTEKAAGESANNEAKLDLAQATYEIGRTFSRKKEFPSAIEKIKKAIALYDQIIAKDAQNSEVQKFKFEAQIELGKVFLAQGNEKTAIEIYQAALAEAKTAPKLKNTPFVAFAEGIVHEKLGDIFQAKNDPMNAKNEYQKSLEIWQKTESSPESFGYSAEMLAFLKQKTNQ
ncbi:MAG: serine/threonine-protein kinase [Pyrinomonadaceae bacterium]|nr:serine/threonine-protein kinase [Pyrinomonadaceae bacterium]